MAKKNSTKTATKEAMAASEPRLQQFKGWKGINLSSKPEGWTPEDPDDNQTDLPMNFFMVQDNVLPTKTGSVETRNGLKIVATGNKNGKFTGVVEVKDNWIYAAYADYSDTNISESVDDNRSIDHIILKRQIDNPSLPDDHWEEVPFSDIDVVESTDFKHHVKWTDFGFYCVDGDVKMLALANDNITKEDAIFISHGNKMRLVRSKKIPNPFEEGAWDWVDQERPGWYKRPFFGVECIGDVGEVINYNTQAGNEGDQKVSVSDITFYISLTNEFGTTMLCPAENAITVRTTKGMTQFDFDNYIRVYGQIGGAVNPTGQYPSTFWSENTFWYTEEDDSGTWKRKCKATGVDVYYTQNNYTYPIYAGHAIVGSDGTWDFNFYGALNGTYDYGGQSTAVPDENTTGGPDATHMTQIDGRMYFYGCTKHPERLYIGGNAGHEASVARGYGGAFVDINPGTGLEIKAVHKFKTASGANIVTILCSSSNSGRSKRFNLLETTISLTQEDAERTYIVEEVENVVGCTSFYGSGVWEDGMYYTDRYGIMVTTQQMEYSSQLRSTAISDPISPIFTDRLAVDMENARLTYINGTMYLALAKPDGDELERIIFCYDMQLKAWYTISLPQFSDEKIIHIFSIDYKGWTEGLGIMTESSIYLLPTTGEYDAENYENFVSCLETGEMSTTIPPTATAYLCQLEFDFDWFIGNLEITVEGVDYYGRHVKAVKRISSRNLNRNFQEWMRIDQIMRSYSITIKGAARYKLTTIIAKIYLKSKKVNLVYGFDDMISYKNRFGATKFVHRKVDSYNNLKECILP